MAAFSEFEEVVDPRGKTFLDWSSAFVLSYLGIADDLPIPRDEESWIDWFEDLQETEKFETVLLPQASAYATVGWRRYVNDLTLVLSAE